MLGDTELFVMYRWILAGVCTVYTMVCVGQSLWRWLDYFGSSRRTMVLGRYAGVLMLRLRLRRFGWELGQIAVLLAILCYVVYLHRSVSV